MPLHDHSAPPARRRIWALAPGIALTVLTLSSCGLVGVQGDVSNGFLPQGVTKGAERVTNLWIGSWIAALAVGVIVWGLILWCVVAYARRKGDASMPEQLQYNVPIEILYTVVPMFMVAVLFYYTARDESALLDTSKKPDVVINVIGKQWSWDFNYVDANTYESGTQAELTGKPGVEKTLPTLYLPVNERIEFQLTSRDVIHSFWVPAFLQKLDVIPGRVNRFQVVTEEKGTFAGKCAELCGAYHSRMLFNVKVVDQAEYQQHLAALKAEGNVGQLSNDLNREHIIPQDENKLTNAGSN